MKKILILFFLSLLLFIPAQKKNVHKKAASPVNKANINTDYLKINDSIPALIPHKIGDKFGFVNQKGKVIIKPEYSNVGFFTEDCNLLHSPNAKTRIYGSKKFASVRLKGDDFRINQSGKRVYQIKDSDLGNCKAEIKAQLFHGYVLGKRYGIIQDALFNNPEDYTQFTIYPQYDYLHILEGDDLKNPMIIAVREDQFGIINIHNKTVVPFRYRDIKRNYSWKIARLFEVTEDGTNYFYIDIDGKKY